MKTRTEVRTYKVRWIHDDCGGEFLPTGYATGIPSSPCYEHRCGKCSYLEDTFEGQFPIIVQDEVAS